MESKIRTLLDTVKHPESGMGIHDGGYVDSINIAEGKVTITLRFEKSRDPFAIKIKKRVEEVLAQNILEMSGGELTRYLILIKEGVSPRKIEPKKAVSTTEAVAYTIAIASGKGGVGKSSVTANLAIALRDMGYRVGILDADIYGPSQPILFGVGDYLPEAIVEEGREMIIPAEAHGIKLISIALFIKATDPLMWRGTMASNALKQLLHQTKWGVLDFLLIDLPPGTGDIHLTILDEAKCSSAVIVSTPQGVAIADVVRGVEMFKHPKVNLPIAGIIENMAYFTPDDIADKKYYIFGEGGASRYANENGLDLLGEVPIFEGIMRGGEEGVPATMGDERVSDVFRGIAERVVNKVVK